MSNFEQNIRKIFEDNMGDPEREATILYKVVDEFQILFDVYFKSTLTPEEIWALARATDSVLRNHRNDSKNFADSLMWNILCGGLGNVPRINAIAKLVMDQFDFDKLTFMFSVK